MNIDFWSGKSVFVTGHSGFKGSWLSLWLQLLGARTTGFSLVPPTKPNLFDLCDVASGMKSLVGDVRDQGALTKALREASPEIVIHLAAQPIVREAYADPVTTFAINVLGTVHLLEAVRSTPGVKAVVIITSDKCYENREWFWSYREKSMLGGEDPYSSSKACAEIATSAFRKSFFNPERFSEHGVAVATARAGNVIGGGDWAKDRLVPDVMRSLLENRSIVIRNPHATRPWQHVLEPLNGYLTLAEALYEDGPRCVGAWNFGPSESNDKTVGWIAENLYAMWGTRFQWERDQKPNPHENTYLKLDSSKARSLLNWTTKLDLNATLSSIVTWNQSYQAEANMREVTERQILEFMKMEKVEPSSAFSSSHLAVVAGGGLLHLSTELFSFAEAISREALPYAELFA
ncbi:MAG: CDP-glucose 4,6-dehydratase [Verrucomicrobiota bacterium]